MLRILSTSFTVVQRQIRTQATGHAKLVSSVFFSRDAQKGAFRARQLAVSTAWQRTAIQHPNSGIHEEPVKTRIPDFEGAGPDVAHKFSVGSNGIDDDVRWRRNKNLDKLAKELVELYEQLHELMKSMEEEGGGAVHETSRVKHLGHQVYVQYNNLALDKDAREGNPATITRRESRSVVEHALGALKYRFKVCVTGQPGIGKTRGSMMYALQTLLHSKAAVLYVGYKAGTMKLFLPDANGDYHVWTSKAKEFEYSKVAGDERVVALIDPPETEGYSSNAGCRVLKFASNNAKKHFENWEKDGILLVTSMPSAEEVVAMTEVLWSYRTMRSTDKALNIEKKKEEVRQRIQLIGPVPRQVFNLPLYKLAVEQCLTHARDLTKDMTAEELYGALRGTYAPLLDRHPAQAASRVFLLNPKERSYDTYENRETLKPQLQVRPVACLKLQDRFEKVVKDLHTNDFEDFAFYRTSKDLQVKAEVANARTGMKAASFKRIKYLRDSDRVLYRPNALNFPLVDFVRSSTEWYNAKTGDNLVIALGGAFEFFEGMGLVEERQGAPGWTLSEEGKGRTVRAILTLLTNGGTRTTYTLKAGDITKYGNKDEQINLFNKLVKVEVKDLSSSDPLELGDVIDLKEMDSIKEQVDSVLKLQ